MKLKRIKLIIFMVFLIVLSSTVFGATLIHSYSFTNDGSNTTDDVGSCGMVSTGMTYSTTYPSYTISGDGSTHSARHDNSGDYFKSTNCQDLNTTSGAVSMWIYVDSQATQAGLWQICDQADGDGDCIRVLTNAGGGDGIDAYDWINGATKIVSCTSCMPDDQWNNIVINHDGSQWELWINGVSKSNGSGTDWTDDFDLGNFFLVTSDLRTGGPYGLGNAYEDEFRIYDGGLTPTEIKSIYDYGVISADLPPTITLTIPTTNNTHTSDTTPRFQFLMTNDNATEPTNCTIYVDDISKTGTDWYGITNNTYFDYNSTTLSQANHTFRAECTDVTGTTTTTNYNIVIDTTSPTIIINNPLQDNTSIFYSNINQWIMFNVTMADTYLNSTEFNVTYPNGTLWFTITNTSTTSSLNVLKNQSIVGLVEGQYNISVQAYDDYSANNLVRASNFEIEFNDAPVITSTTPTSQQINTFVGSNINFITVATDDESEALTYKYYFNGTLNNTGASYTFSVPNATGLFNMTVNVSDINGLWTDYTWLLNVSVSPPTMLITSINIWDNSAINGFWYYINSNWFGNDGGTGTIATNLSTGTDINYTIIINKTSYFNRTYVNINPSINQSWIAELYQNVLRPQCFDIINNSLNCTTPIFVDTGTNNVTFEVNGYFNITQEETLTGLQNITTNVTGFYSTNLTLQSNYLVGSGVTNCTYYLDGISNSFNGVVNTTNTNTSIGIINGTYNATALCDGFAPDTANITINSTLQNLTFNLYTENSMLFTIYNKTDFSLLNGTNVTIDLHGTTTDYSFWTNNGTLFVDGLINDTYEITFTTLTTNPVILYGTLVSGDFLSIDVYLQGGLVSKDFVVKDTLSNFLDGVVLTFTELINGSEITIGQTTTDFSGRASIYLDETVSYSIISVKEGFDTFTGSVTPTQNEYPIIMTQIGLQRFVSVFEDIVYLTGIDYTAGNNYAMPFLIINSIGGSLQYYGFTTTYDSVTYLVNNTGVPAGGIEEINITPLTNSERFLTVTYFFKATGYDVIEWDVPYLLINTTPTNLTLTSGMFDDIVSTDEFDPIRVGIGMFIIILLALMFAYGSSNNTSAITIGIMMGLGICLKFSLLPTKLVTVALIVLGAVLIADNVWGR